MKIVALGCVHNDIEKLPALFDKIKELKPDVIVSVGDILDAEIPKGFTTVDIGKIVVSELADLAEKVFFVPGTWDKDLISLYEKAGISLHGKGIIIGSIGLYGFGGAQTPFNTPYEPSEDEIYKGLKKASSEVEAAKHKIQFTHAPPKFTSLDLLPTGEHVGSEAVRKVIEEVQPDVAVCAHIHEGRGTDILGKTRILNVGKLTEGYCGVIDVSEEKIAVELTALI